MGRRDLLVLEPVRFVRCSHQNYLSATMTRKRLPTVPSVRRGLGQTTSSGAEVIPLCMKCLLPVLLSEQHVQIHDSGDQNSGESAKRIACPSLVSHTLVLVCATLSGLTHAARLWSAHRAAQRQRLRCALECMGCVRWLFGFERAGRAGSHTYVPSQTELGFDFLSRCSRLRSRRAIMDCAYSECRVIYDIAYERIVL